MSDPTIRAALDAAANSLRQGFLSGGRTYQEDAAAAIAAFLRALGKAAYAGCALPTALAAAVEDAARCGATKEREG